jgi:hypothetical protein
MLAIEVLVEAIIVSGTVLKEQRRGAHLARLMASFQEFGMRCGKADVFAHSLMPAIGERREVWIKRSPQPCDERR